jgi:NAD-dependent dihydropyrimidine dehydrogenase PreA subunit
MGYVITDECVACGTCLDECSNGAIKEGEEKYTITDECIECGECVESCPTGAIVEG